MYLPELEVETDEVTVLALYVVFLGLAVLSYLHALTQRQ